MALQTFKARDFRCLAEAELEPDSRFNLVYGDNASGKTSLLEAIAYLGRGRSFRGASTQNLIRHSAREFVLFGKILRQDRVFSLGARNGPGGLEVSIDGERGGGAAALARRLPLQVIDPEIHNLVSGGPEERRRYLDWIVFHVEPNYLDDWRRFRRVLKQRNAALKAAATTAELESWDHEFVVLGNRVQEARARVFEVAVPRLVAAAESLLQRDIGFEYRRGWSEDLSLAEALIAGRWRDQQLGSTQAGPQRADIRLIYDHRQARRLVSRGQQKLLSCAMVLAATEIAQEELKRPLLLLLDDPAAELDSASLGRLMDRVVALGCQVIATALEPQADLFPQPPAMFHVEQGVLRGVG